MSPEAVERFALGAFILTLFCFCFVRRLWTKETARNLELYQALRSPSIRNAANAFDRRIAFATREAAKGFRLCEGCGFENAQRSVSCALCGASLPEDGNAIARFFGGSKQEQPTQSHAHLSSRQRRIRRRREWTRRRDHQGALVWSYEASSPDAQAPMYPVYVLKFTRAEPEEPDVDDDKKDASISLEESHHVTIEVDESALGEVFKSLRTTSSASGMEIVPVTQGSDVTACEQKVDGHCGSICETQLGFPSKMAHFISSTAALFKETTQEGSEKEAPVVLVHVVREALLLDSTRAIASLTATQSRGAIRVDFAGEQGIDAGGVYREWVQLLNQAMVTPEAGIFTCVNSHDQVFYLNPHAKEVLGEDYLAHFLAAGRLLGRALLEGNVTGFHLALPLLKIILGLPVGFDDLEFYDPDIHKNLKWLLDNDGVDALCLDFTVTETLPNGTTKIVELVPGGSEIELTDENKREYVDRKLKYLLFESVSSQLSAFLQGIYEVVPLDLLMVFDAEELDYVLSGSDEIDVDDWEANTLDELATGKSTHKRLMHLPCYENFWTVVRELSTEERRRLLQFTTGSTRPPPGGFGSLTSYDGRLSLFTVRGVPVESTHGNLQSHACFNRLDLPTYWRLSSMREAVHAAISSDVDGFTID